MPDLFSPLILLVALAVIIVVAIVFGAIRRYRIAEPDEAIIVTGRKGKKTIDAEGHTTRRGAACGPGLSSRSPARAVGPPRRGSRRRRPAGRRWRCR